MTELIKQTGDILAQSQELLKQPEIKGAVSGFLSWIGSKIFANKKSKQERLALIEQQKATEQTINDLKSDIRSIVEDNIELQKELAEEVKKVDLLLKQAGIQTTKTNSVTLIGDGKVYQDINNSTITDNSISQTHSGTGDIVGRDKIIGK